MHEYHKTFINNELDFKLICFIAMDYEHFNCKSYLKLIKLTGKRK